MLSEEEKTHIIEKIKFENEIRKKLSTPSEPKKWSWLNNKLSLLIVGALITGILVPLFQYTQKTIDWKKRNQFANINFRLGMMRDCLKEFVYLSAYIAEAYERAIPTMDKTPLTGPDYKKFEQQFLELQNGRYRQNARVKSLMVYFQDIDTLGRLFNNYVNTSSDYLRDLKKCIHTRFCISNPAECRKSEATEVHMAEFKEKIDDYIIRLNESYKNVIAKIKEDIGRAEDETEKFK